MKFATLFVAAVAAQEPALAGEDCSAEQFICQNTNTICINWVDSTGEQMATCQDCLAEARTVSDAMAEAMPFSCPDDVEEKATGLVAGAAAVFVASLMA
mgnify:CR=1 FL=1